MSFINKQLLAGLVIIFGLLVGVFTSFPDEKLHLIFCDVGQGDATLVVWKDKQILIDGGPSEKVLGCLSDNLPFWDKDLEMVILTHPEADHITGLVSVLDRYNVQQIIGNSLMTDSGVFGKFRTRVIEKKIPVYSPKKGDKIKIGKVEFKILHPGEKLGDEIVWKEANDSQVLGAYSGNFNETAIVAELSFGNFDTLLTGDVGTDQEKEIDSLLTDIEVLKVAHHGSKYSTSQEFLARIRPELAVISVGATNRYGHPTTEVLERLKEAGTKVRRTDLDGEIEIVSDGEGWYTKN